MKVFALLLVMLGFTLSSKAQIYAPCYAYYQGVGYFAMPNGYYYGNISGGYPQGEGYCYCIDPTLGPIYYHGYFDKGVVHGRGELLSNSGYICGMWNHGDFVKQIDVSPYQMQQSYTDVWSNYANYYAPTYNYPSYSYPTYNTPTIDYAELFNQAYNQAYQMYSTPTYNYQPYTYSTPPHTTPTITRRIPTKPRYRLTQKSHR